MFRTWVCLLEGILSGVIFSGLCYWDVFVEKEEDIRACKDIEGKEFLNAKQAMNKGSFHTDNVLN